MKSKYTFYQFFTVFRTQNFDPFHGFFVTQFPSRVRSLCVWQSKSIPINNRWTRLKRWKIIYRNLYVPWNEAQWSNVTFRPTNCMDQSICIGCSPKLPKLFVWWCCLLLLNKWSWIMRQLFHLACTMVFRRINRWSRTVICQKIYWREKISRRPDGRANNLICDPLYILLYFIFATMWNL